MSRPPKSLAEAWTQILLVGGAIPLGACTDRVIEAQFAADGGGPDTDALDDDGFDPTGADPSDTDDRVGVTDAAGEPALPLAEHWALVSVLTVDGRPRAPALVR